MAVRETLQRFGVTWAEAAQALSRRLCELRDLEAGEVEVVEVSLECCWREGCVAAVPREDELGLCRECHMYLRSL